MAVKFNSYNSGYVILETHFYGILSYKRNSLEA